MAEPVRIRLSRARGFGLQALSRATNGLPAIVVARPSRWGNPHRWQSCPADIGPANWARGAAVDAFQEDLRAGRLRFTCEEVRAELAGHNIACWCPLDGPCHGDVLLDIARWAALAREAAHA
ncbi:DUF4326 domain-containing protein [Lichenibacterium dinghuense]|uniref:DUF4326 domain-containing protein n=1 Tax=Lichenibacterium dinghuense TaxID=2895977 RepID=UPI001F37A83F|nr:DUF4326 domain-containing protein [Lichenibacterium sp. 6Y81]